MGASAPSGACQTRGTLDLIGDKWSLLVVGLLGQGRRRFSELKREIEDISQRMLTLTLRHLEREGLVERTVFPVVPPRVDYELTDMGHTLLETVQSLIDWAIANNERIVAGPGTVRRRARSARGGPSGDVGGRSPCALRVMLLLGVATGG